MNTRKYVAELLGTFLFMTIGYLSVAAFAAADAPNLLVVPFSFGFGLLAAIFAFGHISGGHFNPAVTVAVVVDGRTTPMDAVGYIVAQVIGAIGAAAVVLGRARARPRSRPASPSPAPASRTSARSSSRSCSPPASSRSSSRATKHAPSLAALAIPLTLVAIHFASATLSGASVNPARSIGSALVGGDLSAAVDLHRRRRSSAACSARSSTGGLVAAEDASKDVALEA